MKTKTLILGAIFSILSGNLFAQIKVMNSGRVAMGTNAIDTINKVTIDGTRFISLHLTNNHLTDSGIRMLSHVNRCSTRCYVVELDTTKTFWVNGCGQITAQGGIISGSQILVQNGGLVVSNGDINVDNGNVNATVLFARKKLSTTGTAKIDRSIIGRIIRFFSDSTLKYGFDSIASPLDRIMLLQGYSYRYIPMSDDSEYVDSSINGRYLGFKAQEVATVVPEAVGREYGNDSGLYAIDLGAISALLVEAMKVQQNQVLALQTNLSNAQADIVNLQSTITTLTGDMSDLTTLVTTLQSRLDICCPPEQANPTGKTAGDDTKDMFVTPQKAALYQNNPNPFSEDTRIGFSLPINCGPAMIVISDLTGKQVQRVDIKGFDTKEISIKAGSLSPGTYNYTLVCQGKMIDTKQMMIIQ